MLSSDWSESSKLRVAAWSVSDVSVPSVASMITVGGDGQAERPAHGLPRLPTISVGRQGTNECSCCPMVSFLGYYYSTG